MERLRRYLQWQKAPGWLGVLIAALTAIWRAVETWGDVDFLISDAKEWVWVGDVVQSPFFTLAAVVVGIVWLLAVGNPAPVTIQPAVSYRTTKSNPYVISDDMRWEDEGDYNWPHDRAGEMRVKGPLCPSDMKPLRYEGEMRFGRKTRQILPSDSLSDLGCVECGGVGFGESTRTVAEAEEEAVTRLYGERNRARNGT